MSRRCLVMCAAFATCVSLCGCIESENPLSDPHEAVTDAKLLGSWRQSDQEGHYLHFLRIGLDRREAGRTRVAWTRVVNIEHSMSGDDNVSAVFCFPTKIGESRYLNLLLIEPQSDADHLAFYKAIYDDKLDAEKMLELVSGYWIVKYEVSDDELKLYAADNKVIKKAIADGAIKGQRNKVSDTTDNVVRYLASAGDVAFPPGNVSHYSRVK